MFDIKKETIKTEKKSMKEVIVENKYKIIAGTSIIVSGTLAVLLFNAKTDLSSIHRASEILEENIKPLQDRNYILESALNESLFEEAIATTVRKLNSRKDKLKYLMEISKDITKDKLFLKIEGEVEVLSKRLKTFRDAQTKCNR